MVFSSLYHGPLPIMNTFKNQLKMLFATPQGWFSWFIANVITSLPWILPLIYGFVFKDNTGYVIAGSIWTFMMLPVTPFWILNVIIAVFLRNKVIRGSQVSITSFDYNRNK